MQHDSYERIILGIDPGTQVLGYGVIGTKGKKFDMLDLGVLRLEKIEEHTDRLKRIHLRVTELILLHGVDEMAIEAPFYGKNVQSMLKLGRAQGVAIAAALSRQMPVFEYSPAKIKQSVTGKGDSTKEQVAMFLQNLFKTKLQTEKLDATDGLAAAVCHFFQAEPGKIGKTKTYAPKRTSWLNFITKNPDKLR